MNRFFKAKFFVLILLVLPSLSQASEVDEDLAACLTVWKKHPFKKENPDYRTITAKVKVMGIGGDVMDDRATKEPELIFVKPNVSVMAKTKYSLLNSNGWYCMKSSVAVMGKTAIEVACGAHFASSQDGVAVLGANDEEAGGVAVMGSVRIKRVGDCNKSDKAEAKPENESK